MPDLVYHTQLSLPRHAVSPRQVARAGEIWRLCQDAAVLASAAGGWDPPRYERERTAFIVFGMCVRHTRELSYGGEVHARTWVRDFRRGTLSTREVRLDGPGGPLAAATQRWVHVGPDRKPARACPDLLRAFPVVPTDEPEVALPAATPVDGAAWSFTLQPWFVHMDPLGHVNHPMYVDFCDESLARHLAARGLDPHRLAPVAEEVSFKNAAEALVDVVVDSRVTGRVGEAWVVAHTLRTRDGAPCARATTVRRWTGPDADEFHAAMGAP